MSIFSYFKPIITALSPNAEKDDIFLALNLFLPWSWSKWQKGKDIQQLENKFKEYFNVKYAISFSSGRVGLYAILSVIASPALAGRNNPADEAAKHGIASSLPKVASRNDNDKNLRFEIITQAYTTIALPNAIKWAGFKPVYVDIKENTYNTDPDKIEAKISAKTKALIVQHTFGLPTEMDRIQTLCQKHKLFLIEDCAHSLGAEFNGQKVGTFGDAAFFSFGRDKIISAVNGGMVITNNELLAEKIKAYRDSLSWPPLFWIFQRLAHPLIFALALPLYYFFNLGKFKIYFCQKIGIITRAYNDREKKGEESRENYKLPNALAVLALNQFKKIEKFNEHRRRLARFYEKNIQDKAIKKPEFMKNAKATPLYYTIQISNRGEILKIAQKNRIILGNWFPAALGPENIDLNNFGYQKGECPVAEKAGRQSLNLPTNIKTNDEDALKVVKLLNLNKR